MLNVVFAMPVLITVISAALLPPPRLLLLPADAGLRCNDTEIHTNPAVNYIIRKLKEELSGL